MQQSLPDPAPQMQFATPQFQHLQQPMMLCPVQYVYEQQILTPDEQIQSNPPSAFQNQGFVLNVNNTPPWAQKPNMVYMQQMLPNNINPYLPQQMVQNPLYNYQYQPMIVQDHLRQIPFMNQNMIQNVIQNQQILQNVVQNPPMMQSVIPQMVPTAIPNVQTQNQMPAAQNQMQNSQSQMSSGMQNPQTQSSGSNPAQSVQNTVQNQAVSTPSVISQNLLQNQLRFQMEKRDMPILAQMLNMRKPTPCQNELIPPIVIRPQFQNLRPQMIIVNPIANHTCMQHIQKEQPMVSNEKKTEPEKLVKNDVPQSVRSQVPDGLSVKTVKGPNTMFVKPTEIQNIAPANDTNLQANYKRKLQDLVEYKNKESEGNEFKRTCLVHKSDQQVFKAQILIDTPPVSEAQGLSNEPMTNIQGIGIDRPIEEKMIRNTVYVQARGRVNEKNMNVAKINNINKNNDKTQNSNIEVFNFVVENNSVLQTNANNANSANKTQSQRIAKNNINKTRNNVVRHTSISMETNNLNKLKNNTIKIINDFSIEKALPPPPPSVEKMQDIPIENAMETDTNPNDQVVEENTCKEKDSSSVQEETRVKEKEMIVKEKKKSDDVILLQNQLKDGAETQNNTTPVKKVQQLNKATATDVSQMLKLIFAQDPNKPRNKSTMTLISRLPKSPEDDDGSLNKGTMTDVSKLISSTVTSYENQNTPKVTIDDDLRRKKKVATKDVVIIQKTPKKHKTAMIEKHTNAQKVEMINGNVKQVPVQHYVLTHVLDGYIIQESNVPFVVQKLQSPKKQKENQKITLPSLIKMTQIENQKVSELSLNKDTNKENEIGSEPSISKERNKTNENVSEAPINEETNEANQIETGSLNENTDNENKIAAKPSLDENTDEAKKRVIEPYLNKETDKEIEIAVETLSKETNKEKDVSEPSQGGPVIVQVITSTDIARPLNFEDIDDISSTATELSTDIHTEDTEGNDRYDTGTETETDTVVNEELNDADIESTNEDDLFSHLRRDVIESWTVADLFSYLMKQEHWRDTAEKLREQEIDGESLLLVNKEQLLKISVCEEHAQELGDFVERIQ